MKILIIGNQARSTYLFWSVLMQHMQQAGHEVICCVPEQVNDPYIAALQNKKIRITTYSLERKGTNPWQDIKSSYALYKILRQEKPHKVFTFSIKPVIYGNIAAKLAGIEEVFSCITGLGLSFQPAHTPFMKLLHNIVILLYKISLRHAKGIIFQNTADAEAFMQKKIIPSNYPTLTCHGTGVDIDYFAFDPSFPKDITFLVIARLLEAKGIADFAYAAKILKSKYANIHCQLLGPAEYGLGALDLNQVQNWQKKGYIEYLGATDDVRSFISKASVIVLPSWREGLSCALMEAMSMGRPIVASNVPGCKELIEEGKNGFLVRPKDGVALAKALEKFILDAKLLSNMGNHGRYLAEHVFDARKVVFQIMQYMNITQE